MELGSQEWLDRCCERINGSQSYRDAAQGWRCPLGLAFLDADGEPVHHTVLRLKDGGCDAADEVTREDFERAPVRLTAPYDVWQEVLSGDLHPLKAIMLKRIRMDGDMLQIVKYAAAARALFDCVAEVDADAPAADAS